jgi:hypothetical protein
MATDMRNLIPIGRMAIFYLPASKVSDSLRLRVERFLIGNFKGYTCQRVNIEGAWASSGGSVSLDSNIRFEASFAGKDRIPMLVDFLSGLCHEMREDALYLTMGEDSYLVTPRES